MVIQKINIAKPSKVNFQLTGSLWGSKFLHYPDNLWDNRCHLANRLHFWNDQSIYLMTRLQQRRQFQFGSLVVWSLGWWWALLFAQVNRSVMRMLFWVCSNQNGGALAGLVVLIGTGRWGTGENDHLQMGLGGICNGFHPTVLVAVGFCSWC